MTGEQIVALYEFITHESLYYYSFADSPLASVA